MKAAMTGCPRMLFLTLISVCLERTYSHMNSLTPGTGNIDARKDSLLRISSSP